MIAELKPYKKQIDSKQKWLGRIPEHWQLLPNRAIFKEIKDRNHPDAEMLSVTITKGVIKQQRLLENSSKKDSSNLDKSKYKLVCPGDIAYNKMRAWQGAIGKSDYEGIISPAYVVMRLREEKNNPEYFHYLFRTPAFAKEAERWSYGITSDMWSLRPEHFKLIYSIIPSIEEQNKIVKYLNYITHKIDVVIAAKKKIIALLNEQKQAIIHRAVTRGLDPNVKLKDSGIPWIGKVPEHWEVRKLKNIAKINPSKIEAGSKLTNDTEVTFLPMEYVEVDGRINADSIVLYYKIVSGLTYFRKNDIIVAKITPCFENGKGAYLNTMRTEFGFGSTEFHVLRARKEILPEYLYFISKSPMFMDLGTKSMSGTAGQQRVTNEFISNFMLFLPDVDEQLKILKSLKALITKNDNVLLQLKNEITFLSELKVKIISDVVTGKLEVQGLVIAEFKEIDDSATGEGKNGDN
jgi:type I restriction enzyme S subunit